MNTTKMIQRIDAMREQLDEMSAAGVAQREFTAATQALDMLAATLELRRVQLRPTVADLERVREWIEAPWPARWCDTEIRDMARSKSEHPFWALVQDVRDAVARSASHTFKAQDKLDQLYKVIDTLLSVACDVKIYSFNDEREDAIMAALWSAGFKLAKVDGDDITATYNRATGYDRAVLDRLVAAGVIDGYTDLAQEAAERWLV